MCVVFFKVILCNSRALPDGRTHVPNTPHYQFIPIKYANRFSGSFLASMNVRTNKNLKEPHYHIKKKGIYNVINRMLIRLLPLNSLAS